MQDKNLKLYYLNALTTLTSILSSQRKAFQFKFPHKLDIVNLMVVSTSQEDGGGNTERREDVSLWKPLVVLLS